MIRFILENLQVIINISVVGIVFILGAVYGAKRTARLFNESKE